MTRAGRRLERMSTTEIAAIDKEQALLVVPIGSIEQHGPHLPVFTDSLVAESIAHGALEQLGEDGPDVFVLPTITYGRSVEHVGFAGTFAVTTQTLSALCADLGRSAAASGFRQLVFVNGHGGNAQLLEVVARDIRAETGLMVFAVSLVHFKLPPPLSEPDVSFSMHGGFAETSVMLALAGETVHMERAEAGGRAAGALFEASPYYGHLPAAWLTADLSLNGVIGDPRGASLDAGKEIVAAWQSELATLYRTIGDYRFEPFD
jgi:creatinine amidohydrolase